MSQVLLSRPASQLGSGSKQPGVPNLPEIPHPLSRLGNPDKLNVRGLSSSHGRPFSNPTKPGEIPFSNITPRVSKSSSGRHASATERKSLPRIPQPFQSIPEGVEVVHTEDNKAKLPVFGARADLASRAESRISMVSRSQSRPSTQSRLEVDELEMMMRERIRKNYFELRKLFLANDPEGRGNVSRDALARIVISFLGKFVSLKQFNMLMSRLHLGERQVISLEEFYAAFRKQEKDGMPEWMDPVNRENDKVTMTASQVHLQLKDKAKQRFVDLAGLIPQINPGGSGRILKPEFRNTLNKLLFFMDDNEFEKLWARYDQSGYGVVNGEQLLNKLGISLREGSVQPGKRSAEAIRSPTGSPREKQSPRRSLKKSDVERTKSLDVERWLKDKFRIGCKNMKKEFELLDEERKGTVPADKFLFVLDKFGLKLEGKQLDGFLARCNMTMRPGGKVSYREFLHRFQDRSTEGMPNKILADPSHRYNNAEGKEMDEQASISAIEATLINMFQSDYLGLLGVFQQLDKIGERVITKEQFRAAIESRFNLNLSDIEFEQFLDSVPLDVEGNVKYQDFMSQFDAKPAPSLFDARSHYNPTRPDDLMADDEPMDFQEFKKTRTTAEVLEIMKQTVLGRAAELQECFHELDESNSGKLSQETMYQLLRRLNIKPEISRGEIRRVWSTFIVTNTGHLRFQEFIRFFGYSVRSAAFPNAKLSPPKRGDSDFLIRSRKLNCAADMLEDNLRSKVDYRWDDLRKEFLELDRFGTGFISQEEFREVLTELCVHLNYYELDMLCKKFDTNNDGRVSYVEFLKPFAARKQTFKYGNNMLGLLTHPQSEIPIAPIVDEPHKGLNGLTARLRQKLVGDWRNLRRAFKKVDPQNTGYLSLPEFRQVLSLCNLLLTEEEVYHVMSEFDEKMDGKISYKKFLSETFSNDPKAV
ncbi:EF-hand calcium-binding domain-containing protein 6 [Holothuria leucospilota]|uniref:EF-hand calcium-binding domain-containing protein 6 n=1 Tax=Holothuria leucospilota TaxID=206669 RepID=A0A9Q0YLW4_HOLLE|nr:EF-hand calcium-binding domain-containing protein 6 [Holothuria leucospilota]